MAYPCVCSLWFKGIFFLNVRGNGTGSCQSKNVELPEADPFKWCQFLYWSPFLSVPSLGLFVQVLIIWIPKPTPLCSDFKQALSDFSVLFLECLCSTAVFRLCCSPEMLVMLGKSISVTTSQSLISAYLCGTCLKVFIYPHCDGTTCLCCQLFRFTWL